MANLRITKGNIVLEYGGSSDEVKELLFDILERKTVNRVVIGKTPESKSDVQEPPQLTPMEEVRERLPSKQDVINYIVSKPNFEHNSAEIQERFLNRHIKSKEEVRFYYNFAQILRDARADIVREYNGKWIDIGSTTLKGRSHVKNYKFVKSDAPLMQENLSPQNLFSLVKTK